MAKNNYFGWPQADQQLQQDRLLQQRLLSSSVIFPFPSSRLHPVCKAIERTLFKKEVQSFDNTLAGSCSGQFNINADLIRETVFSFFPGGGSKPPPFFQTSCCEAALCFCVKSSRTGEVLISLAVELPPASERRSHTQTLPFPPPSAPPFLQQPAAARPRCRRAGRFL